MTWCNFIASTVVMLGLFSIAGIISLTLTGIYYKIKDYINERKGGNENETIR